MNLAPHHISTLQNLFAKHPSIKEALLFGSRALGTHRESSDIDIALKGDISPTLIAHLKEELEDSTLPYFCDIISYEKAPKKLKESIDSHALPLYTKEEQWQEVRLGEVVEIIGGGTPKTSIAEYWNGDIPWLSIADFNNDSKFVYQTEKTITLLGLEKSSTKMLKKGDIIFSARGTIGAIAMLGKDMAFNQSCYGIRAKKEIDRHYLYYLLKSLKPLFHSNAYGSVFDTITKENFSQIIVSLPPLERQREIAEILSSFDDKIDFLHRQNRTLEALNQIVFTEWFINQAKDEWQEIELGKYLQCITGYSYKSSELGESKNALVNLKNFSRSGDFRLDGLKEFTGTKYKESQIVKHGDLVVAHTDITQEADIVGNPILVIDMGKYENLIISMDLMKIKSNKEWLSTEFLYYLFKTPFFKQYCLANSNGTTVLHMSRQTIPTYKIKISSIKKIENFTIYAREKLKKKYNNLLQISILENLRNQILQNMQG